MYMYSKSPFPPRVRVWLRETRRVPKAVVTFESREEALGAWHEVKGEAISVHRCDRGDRTVGQKLTMV